MKTILKSTDDGSPKTPAMSNVWNDMTKHSVVFLPKSDTILVAMPSVTGEPGDYVTIPISGDISHE